jgi:hypothetical protein
VRKLLVGIGIALGFVGLVSIAIREQMRVECEVCVAYGGRQACESTVAGDRDQALMQAHATACAQISGGVTGGIQCNNTPALRTHCSE